MALFSWCAVANWTIDSMRKRFLGTKPEHTQTHITISCRHSTVNVFVGWTFFGLTLSLWQTSIQTIFRDRHTCIHTYTFAVFYHKLCCAIFASHMTITSNNDANPKRKKTYTLTLYQSSRGWCKQRYKEVEKGVCLTLSMGDDTSNLTHQFRRKIKRKVRGKSITTPQHNTQHDRSLRRHELSQKFVTRFLSTAK